MNIISQINGLITSAAATVKKRGYELYNEGMYDLDLQEEGDYYFLVEGNTEDHYETGVFIDEETESVDIDCSCAYFAKGEVCKHLVACLLYVKEDVVTKISKEDNVISLLTGKKVVTERPILIKEKAPALKQPISLQFTEAELVEPENKLRPLRDDAEARKMAPSEMRFLPNKLSLKLTNKTMWYNPFASVEANITFKDGKYLFSCEDVKHKGLCEHIHWLAAFFSIKKDQRLLELINAENQLGILQRMLADYGVEPSGEERVEDMLDIVYEGDSVRFYQKGIIKGLNSPERMKDFLQQHILNNTATAEKKEELVLPKPPEVDFQRLPAFVLSLDLEGEEINELMTISGKPTKNLDKLASHLEMIRSPYEAGLLTNAAFAPAFFLKEKLNIGLKRADEIATLFKDLQELFPLLAQFPLYLKFGSSNFRFSKADDAPKKSDLYQVSSIYTHIRLKFRFYREGQFFVLKPLLVLADGAITLDIEKEQIRVCNGLVLLWGSYHVGLINSVKEGLALAPFLVNPVLRVSEKQHQAYLEEVVKPLAQEFPVEFDEESMLVESVQMQLIQKRVYISELNQYVIFRPVALYEGEREVNVLEDNTLFDTQEQITLLERDRDVEEAFVELICSLHPSFTPATQQSFYYLTFEQMQKGFWFLKAFETLKKHDVHVFGFDKLKNFKFSPHQPTVKVNFKSGQDWFETEVEVAFGNNKVKLKDLKKAVREGSGYIELADGTLGILPEEWLSKFEKLFRSAHIEKDAARIPKTHFNLLDELVDERLNPAVFREIEEKKKRLARFSSIEETSPPALLKAQLRNYQQAGLNWLNFLKEYGWGGILADDMGLGKTLQALALIGLEIERNPKQPNLVIAPTTLLFNWKKEIEKFAPGIDFVIHHGQRYDSETELSSHQLVLTSYGIVVNDVEMLKKIKFNLIIADESQAIKNIHSQRHKAITRLQGRVRLGMSGTPIENNIFELYAQMNFANPGFFQGLSAFKADYAKPVEQDRNEAIIEELKRKIKPFILRRTKAQVLTELPDKTEEYLYCEMGAAQRKVYDAYRNEYRDYLLNKFEEQGVEKSQMYVLEGLTKLRQVCDSPLLVESDFPADKASAKMEELLTHVMEKTGRHKILVFSQFVGMLQLIEKQFQKLSIPYEYLDGKTSLKEREIRVQRFQEDPDRRVFLISLKAGGTGLNLTAADYVYLVDPWWNPAVENQAIDRCYRMGQEKKVFAYRMICKDTVEEKIIQLQEQKKLLSDDLVGSGEGVMKNLSKEDIVGLFS